MAEGKTDQRVAAVRRFNRFYTRKIGLLHEGYLASAFSLTEGRVLYELAHQDGVTAGALGRELGLDPGYLSRIVRGFEKRDEGTAVLIVSVELDEVLALADRIAVMYRGKIVDILPAETAQRERLGLLMAGSGVVAGATPSQGASGGAEP